MGFGVKYDVPSTAETIGMFLIDILLYALLAWYFDHVDESNRGKSYDKLFFMSPSYWFDLKRAKPLALPTSNGETPKSNDFKSENNHGYSSSSKRNSSSVNSYMNINPCAPEKLLNEQVDGLNKGGNKN